ncbi:hypothetical protein D4764_06G0003320 [Takifugu flavidus]|uniref:Uncharacterized protein n=1 Tax=Takifugu flavidus TaxID=433684 RepID=A0A5C6MU85_9TELE|nr:hypothetical protein D4764_06G0003320 [Takifugu flavidus]
MNKQIPARTNTVFHTCVFPPVCKTRQKSYFVWIFASQNISWLGTHMCMKQMDLPFSGFELTFITIAFFIFSLYTLASIFIQPSATESDTDFEVLDSKALTKKQRVITKEAQWRRS